MIDEFPLGKAMSGLGQSGKSQSEQMFSALLPKAEPPIYEFITHALGASLRHRDRRAQALMSADFTGARPLCERALATCEKVLGPEHPDTATSLNILAFLLLRHQGDVSGARPLCERALAIREKVLGPEHPDDATSLSNLAALLRNQGDPAGARLLNERALAIREKVLGPEHPDTATSLSNLALLLREFGNVDAAEPPFRRTVAVAERALGRGLRLHSNKLVDISNVGVDHLTKRMPD